MITITIDGDFKQVCADKNNSDAIFIDGFWVTKGKGNNDHEKMEPGDRCLGWEGVDLVGFVVNELGDRLYTMNQQITKNEE